MMPAAAASRLCAPLTYLPRPSDHIATGARFGRDNQRDAAVCSMMDLTLGYTTLKTWPEWSGDTLSSVHC